MPMRGPIYVVDTNSLDSADTQRYLMTPSHELYLPREIAYEALSSGSAGQVLQQFEFLHRHYNQVSILRDIQEVIAIDPSKAQVGAALVDHVQTDAFRGFAQAINRGGTEALLARGALHRMMQNAKSISIAKSTYTRDMEEDLRWFRSNLSYADLASIKSHSTLSPDLSLKLHEMAIDMTAEVIIRRKLPISDPENHRDLYNGFIFRSNLHYVNLFVELIGGGTTRRKPSKVVNDSFDIIASTYASYFDGIITKDKVIRTLHLIVKVACIHKDAETRPFPMFDGDLERSQRWVFEANFS